LQGLVGRARQVGDAARGVAGLEGFGSHGSSDRDNRTMQAPAELAGKRRPAVAGS
jgi:hypothetical protein